MEITNVRVYVLNGESNVKGIVSITICGVLVINDIRIVDVNGKKIVAMPSKKKKDGSFGDVIHPINSETRKYLEHLVLEAYEKEVEKLTRRRAI